MRQWRRYKSTYRIKHPQYYIKGKRNLTRQEERTLFGGTVTVTEKMDGANTGLFKKNDKMFLQKRGSLVDDSHPQFKFFKNQWFWDNYEKLEQLPDNAVTYGELMRCTHTIHYDKLPDWWLVFDIYDLQKHQYLPWHEVARICYDIGLSTVPHIFTGSCMDRPTISEIMPIESIYGNRAEGIVVKNYKKQMRGKVVHPEFIKDPSFDKHWSSRTATFNKLER